jgi:hypothetical protein
MISITEFSNIFAELCRPIFVFVLRNDSKPQKLVDFLQIHDLLGLQLFNSLNLLRLFLLGVRLQKPLLHKLLALQGNGLVNIPEQIVPGVVLVGIFRWVFHISNGGEVRGLVLLKVIFLELSGSRGLAMDLLESGHSVLGILVGFGWVVV